jgi:hypothetical protein
MKRVLLIAACLTACGTPEVQLPPSEIPPAVVIVVDNPEVPDQDERALARETEDAMSRASERLGLCTVDTAYVYACASAWELTEHTGMGPRTAAVTRGDSLYTQRPQALADHRILRSTVRHEAVHLCLGGLSTRLPRWFEEGLALLMTGERPSAPTLRTSSTTELDSVLVSDSPWDVASARSTAFVLVRRIHIDGDWDGIRATLASVRDGASFERAFVQVYGRPPESFLPD